MIAVLATGLVASGLAAPAAARAAAGTGYAGLRLTYDNPEVAADRSGVTWHWTLANDGTGAADTVVATHRLSAAQRVVAVSAPCAGEEAGVVCRFDALQPGQSIAGWIRTEVPTKSGDLRVDAQVTWKEKNPPPTPPSIPQGPPAYAGLSPWMGTLPNMPVMPRPQSGGSLSVSVSAPPAPPR